MSVVLFQYAFVLFHWNKKIVIFTKLFEASYIVQYIHVQEGSKLWKKNEISYEGFT